MNDLEEIQCILWHELGHFLIDLHLIEVHTGISINEILIRNYECENVNWCGWVDLKPKANLKYEEVIKDLSLTAFKFISLPSGCLFQSKNAPDKIDFNDCFAFKRKAIGKGDHDKFWELEFQLRKNNEVNDNDKKAFFESLNTIVFEKYINEVGKLNEFQKGLKIIIDRESNIILADYINKKTPENYSFRFEGEYLDNLSVELTALMSKYNFSDVIKNIHSAITTLISKHIIKK